MADKEKKPPPWRERAMGIAMAAATVVGTKVGEWLWENRKRLYGAARRLVHRVFNKVEKGEEDGRSDECNGKAGDDDGRGGDASGVEEHGDAKGGGDTEGPTRTKAAQDQAKES